MSRRGMEWPRFPALRHQTPLMRRSSIRGLFFFVVLAAIIFLGLASFSGPWARWRQSLVYEAIENGRSPSFWWPPGWRQEWRSSLTLAGELSTARAGTLEIVAGGKVVRTSVSKGRYSLSDQILPAGPLKARFISPDGTESPWIVFPEVDPGRHRLNLSF